MRVIVCKNYEEMSAQAAKLVASQITLKPDSVLGLATGSTPVGAYKVLIDKCEKGELDLSKAADPAADMKVNTKKIDHLLQ